MSEHYSYSASANRVGLDSRLFRNGDKWHGTPYWVLAGPPPDGKRTWTPIEKVYSDPDGMHKAVKQVERIADRASSAQRVTFTAPFRSESQWVAEALVAPLRLRSGSAKRLGINLDFAEHVRRHVGPCGEWRYLKPKTHGGPAFVYLVDDEFAGLVLPMMLHDSVVPARPIP